MFTSQSVSIGAGKTNVVPFKPVKVAEVIRHVRAVSDFRSLLGIDRAADLLRR